MTQPGDVHGSRGDLWVGLSGGRRPRRRSLPTGARVSKTAVKSASGLRLTTTAGIPDLPLPSWKRSTQFGLKRLVDIAVSILALAVLSPLLVCLAVLVKATSAGPVVITQKRDGKSGRTFDLLKFRTMYEDKGDPTGVEQTVADDPRITPVGRFMRQSSLDELPQLINILKGEMSLIGPRPHPIGMRAGGELYEDLVPYYNLRRVVRPGLSGWAQANGYRGSTTDPTQATARIEHDLAYIQNFSLWLDFKVILMTLRDEFLHGSGN